MVRLLPLYAKLHNSGVKINFYSVPRIPKTTDANIKLQWLEEAKKLGEEREKMLYSQENTNSFMLDEGIFEDAEHVGKHRPWHTKVLEEWKKIKSN